MPNTRQWALLIWIGAGLIWALTQPKIRQSLGAVVRSLVRPTFAAILVGYLAWIATVISGAASVDLWDTTLGSDTVMWLFISGWAVWASFAKVGSRPEFFRSHVRQIIGWSLVAEFAVDFAVLPLLVELALLPALLLLVSLQAVAERDSERQSIRGVVTGCLAVVVTLLVGFGVTTLITGWGSIDWPSVARQAVLPVWLTVAALPYVYLLGLYSTYETVFRQIDWRSSQSRWRRLVVKSALVSTFGIRGHDLGQLGLQVSFQLAHSTTWSEARKAIRDQQQQNHERNLEEQRKADRLVRLTGSDGADAQGRRLDQREFEETKAALNWLHTCHSGWWRREDRYKADLLELIGAPYQMHGLDVTRGYKEWVSSDGLAWYGWRQTATGWVFAIGANAPPPNEWTYDGPEPPTGPPGVDPSWGDDPFSDEKSPNW